MESVKMKTLRSKLVCGLVGLALLVQPSCAQGIDDYGCLDDQGFESYTEGNHVGDVDCRHYLTSTGVKVKDGDILDVSASGECCWEDNYLCADPEGNSSAWGLYWMFRKDGDDTAYNFVKLGIGYHGEINFPDDSEYELFLVVPEMSDKERCYAEAYKTNEGGYDISINKE